MGEQIKKAAPAKAAVAVKPPKKLVPRTAPKAAPKPVAEVVAPIAAPAAAVAAKPAGSSSVKAPVKVAAPKPAAAKPAVAKPAAAKAATAKPASAQPAAAKAKPVRKASKVDETVAKHQKVLADALVKAQAINYDQPKHVKPVAAKPAKARKVKLVRDSYAMPDNEYAQIGVLKKRLASLGNEVKKSELLRGGIATLAALSDAELKAVMGRIERIKTGRPAK